MDQRGARAVRNDQSCKINISMKTNPSEPIFLQSKDQNEQHTHSFFTWFTCRIAVVKTAVLKIAVSKQLYAKQRSMPNSGHAKQQLWCKLKVIVNRSGQVQVIRCSGKTRHDQK
jgi:hypothetical protein